MKKKKAGRPTSMTPAVLEKLEEAFSYNATDIQACFHAGIHVDTLYNYQKSNPEFTARKMGLKGNTGFKAKKLLSKAVERNPDIALRTLERIEKADYSLRVEHTGNNGEPIEFTWTDK